MYQNNITALYVHFYSQMTIRVTLSYPGGTYDCELHATDRYAIERYSVKLCYRIKRC